MRLSKSAGGNLPFELTFPVANEALWLLLRGALCATESAEVSVASCTTVAASDQITRASGSFITDGFEAGDIVKLSGSTGGSDNGYQKLSSVGALTMRCEPGTVLTGSSGNVLVRRGARMKNGTTDRYFVAEVASLDINKYQLFRGQVVNTLDLQVSDQAILSGTVGFEGKTSTTGGSANGNSYTSTTNTAILDSTGAPVVKLGGIAYSTKSFSIGFRNNAASRTQVGSLGPQSIRKGEFGIELAFQSYFQSFTEMDAYAGNIASNFWTVIENAAGQGLAISLPQMKWTDVGADTQGTNTDDYLNGRAAAYLNPNEGVSARVLRFV